MQRHEEPTKTFYSDGAEGRQLLAELASLHDTQRYREYHWEGSFADYLEIVAKNPKVARSAYQRIYDMILHFGTTEYTQHREKLVHYHFFDDPVGNGEDAIFGLDRYLMTLVNIFKSAARRYGTERRIILLHGPVGSSKSTIVRLLKKGLEYYTRLPEGAVYSFSWVLEDGSVVPCPLNEEPLKLIPIEIRTKFLERLNEGKTEDEQVWVEGDLCPLCRFYFREFMRKYQGDWQKIVENHIRVRRVIFSEKDRIGIGTFQPKDEKSQDATELTGDINYRKIAIYGSESDPRAFDFDGEFCVANRGLLEFIELLKLETEFLYDLLGAAQEHVIKPRKFAQVDIDEVVIGHSVAGATPIPYLHRPTGQVGFATMEELFNRFADRPEELMVLSVDERTRQPVWTPVRGLFRHPFTGPMMQTAQEWGVIETTPNHALYDREMRLFRPAEQREVMAVRSLPIVWQPLTEINLEIPTLEEGQRQEWITQPACGWARFALTRYATQVKIRYRLPHDADDLNALLSLIAWYVAEGHVNSDNGGIVISCTDPEQLERLRVAYQRITTGKGYIDREAKTESPWRLHLGSEAIKELLVTLCGKGVDHKRLPDFVFNLPKAQLEHLWNELMASGGSHKFSGDGRVSEEYQNCSFDYKTASPMLAAQIGFLASLLGMDYSVFLWKRPDGKRDAYRIRFCSGEEKLGDRPHYSLPHLFVREAVNEWVYDIECVGNHNFVCGVGNLCAHNTNEPEYRKLQKNEYMEALRDRTIKVDIPYVLKLSDEVRIYEKFFNPQRVRGKHIAPHTLEIAAMWAILTRLEEPKKFQLSLMQKLKLYDGKALPGFTEDHVLELREEAPREGMFGISPRYVMDKISNALVSEDNPHCVNPFMVIKELDEGLDHYSLISSEEQRKRYRELLALVRQEYEEIIKNEVRRAITADEEALKRLSQNYIENVKAYVRGEKVRNRYTGELEEPDERLMRSVEEKIDIPESRKDDFRREIMNYIASLALEGKQFDYKSNERLLRALELKLFEDQKDSIRLSAIATGVVDKETQEKIDVIKARLVREYGYCDVCATDVLTYVASIFARGDIKEREEARR